jgi:hypothetical protein
VVGETLVDPLAEVEVNPPGLILMLVAPLVAQLKVVLPPAVIVAGLAAKELTVGFDPPTVIVTVSVTDPALFDAVRV